MNKFYTKLNDSGHVVDFFEDIPISDELKELIIFMQNFYINSNYNYNNYMCVAGGYIYDSLKNKYFGEPTNDIDIFTNFSDTYLDSALKKLKLSSSFKPTVFAKNYLNNSETGQNMKGFKHKKLSIHCVNDLDIHKLFDMSLYQAGIYIENGYDVNKIEFRASQHFIEDFPNKITIFKHNITTNLKYSHERFEKYTKKIGKYPEEVNIIPNSSGVKIPISNKINSLDDYAKVMEEADNINKLIIHSKCGTILDDPNPKIF